MLTRSAAHCSKTWAQCYGGHQFGSWAGQLGDGRAINLGDVLGLSGKRWELQLKVIALGDLAYRSQATLTELTRIILRQLQHYGCKFITLTEEVPSSC